MSDKKSTLLIVDDTPDNIHVLMEALSDYSIKVARDGVKALALARTPPKPDLILLDIMMPGMDGYEVCRRLKEDEETYDIPVVFITAKTGEEDETIGFDLGAVDYLTKPVRLPVVQARVQNHLELKFFREALANQNEVLMDKVRERTKKLAAALDRAEEADRAKTEFLANMSHEIRTPFNGLMGVVQLLKSDCTPEMEQYLEMAFQSGRRLEELMTSILEMAVIDAGKAGAERENFNFGDLMSGMYDLFRPSARQTDVEFSLDVDERIPSMMSGFPSRVRQILFNAVGNALKFTPEGGKVTVGAWMLSVGQDDEIRVLFMVEDNGKGIEDNLLGEVFSDFSQLEESVLTRRYQGPGLGLSIVRRLIRMLESEVCLCSEPDVGTTLSFSLIFNPADPDEVPAVRLI